MKQYFFIEKSPYKKDKFFIHINFSLLPENFKTSGSYNVLFARLCNISYANYCRLCRDCFNGEIYGKNHLYPIVYFNKEEEVKKLLNLLNKRMNEVCNLLNF